MKKLLNILATISLATIPSLTTLSCSTKNTANKPVNPIEDKDYLKTIEEFKREVNSMVSSELMKANEKLIELTKDENRNKFLNKSNITTFAGKENTLNKENKNSLLVDLNNKLFIQDIKSKLNTIKNDTKYNIILDGVDNLFDKLEISWNTLNITYKNYERDTSTSENKEKGFASNVKLNFALVINYKDKEGVLEEHKIDGSFIYSLTNDEAIKYFGETTIKELKNKYFIESNKTKKNSLLDASALGLDSKKDKFFNKDSLVASYFNNESFKNDLLTFIKNDLSSTKNNEFIQRLDLSFASNIDTFSKIDYLVKLQNKSPKSYAWKDEKDNGKDIYDFIFKKEYVEPKSDSSNNNDNKIPTLYKYLSGETTSMLKKYKEDLQTFINNLDYFDQAEKEKLLTKDLSCTSKLGYVNLKGLQFKIGNDYSQELPEFRILTGYAVDLDDKNWDDTRFASIDTSKTLSSVYYNTLNGIESFHKTFGIKSPKNERAMSAFTGSTPGIITNLWDLFRAQDNQYRRELNKSLSLKLPTQKEYLDKLLLEGNQSTFNWQFLREAFDVVIFINNSGLFIHQIYTNGEKAVDINFSLDFLNINFTIDGIWAYTTGLTIIEK